MTDKEQKERKMFCDELLSWQNTPYVPEARVKGGGTDCGLLILQALENVGFLPHIDIPHYPFDIACNCSVPIYLNQIKEYCTEISDEPLAGDILVYKFHGALVPHHASVVLNNEYISHSLVREGVVQSNRRGYEKYRVATYRFNRWVGGD